MARGRSSQAGNGKAVFRTIGAAPTPTDGTQARRKLLADWCRSLGDTIKPPTADTAGLSPRHVQTLQCLLAGDSEKEIANRLGVSRHTVHAYVKGLYRHFKVASRGELTARFVRRPVSDAIPTPSPD